MSRSADATDLVALIPGPAIHLVNDEVLAANPAAADLLDHPDGGLAAIGDHDRRRLLAAAAGGREGERLLLQLDDVPPHRFVEAALGPHPAGGVIVVLHDVTERERLDAAIAELASGVYTTDEHLTATWLPRRVAEATGLERASFTGADVYELVHPDDEADTRELVARAKESPGVRCSRPLRVRLPDQPDVWWPIVVHVVWRGDDPALGGLLVRFDMDLAAGLHLRGAEETAQGLVTLSADSATGALHLTVGGDLQQRSTRVREILRPVSDDGDLRWLALLRADDRAMMAERLEAARQGALLPPVEVAFDGRGATVWARLDVLPYRDVRGHVAGMFVNVHDVTAEHRARDELARAREELWQLATHDALTGLPNRHLFTSRLAEATAGSSGSDGADDGPADGAVSGPPAVLVCDLDRFKAVNDVHGHRVGDAVLIEAARRIRSAVRSTDLVCRYGGDEFLVLCAQVEGAAELAALASRIEAAFATPIDVDGIELAVGVSVGGALAEPSDAVDPDALVLRADRVMYDAKAAHRAEH